ncbi:MAG TPA: hypothetical protein VHX38_17510 [Pseudonocardiaceae bacterium]|jgi:hypothetical protein|nr:hypothetical protein [Pseudonocardiaceae bacterium]
MAAGHFTIIANTVARDRALSYAAKGLFLNMASHREGFTITEEFLARQSTDGVKTVRRLLGELRAVGYIYRSVERTRYPAGTRNAAGKDISGALGPYTWFVTDKPEEIAVILAQYATETAGRDNQPAGQVVPSDLPATDRTKHALPAVSADSADQGEQGACAGGDWRPGTTGGSGSSIEDQPQKTMKKTNGGAFARPRTPANRKSLPDSGGGSSCELELVGDPPVARAREERRWWESETLIDHPDHAPLEVTG